MRKEDQERILTELESRVAEELVRSAEGSSGRISDALEESIYHERRRLKDDRSSPKRDSDSAFWDEMQRELRRSTDEAQRVLVRRVVRHYGEEIAGNFDDRVYQMVTRAIPPALSVLLNAVSPFRLASKLPELPSIDDQIIIQGATDHLRKLHDYGTVIFVPTHVSNLDSLVVGYALYRMGLPPFIYGAGLNLFANPLMGFFMHNLGAYTVDRKKTDPLYKEVLKEYATLTMVMGYDNIFFPGGTRSRSGAVERRLKLGLLGTGINAYVENLRRKAPRPKIFIVPATLSFELVLEAETLVEDFLKEVGKGRYIIDDDEFSKPRRVFEFMSKLVSLDSKIHVTVCPPLDPFGNPVDLEGESIDPCGRRIDTERYVLRGGAPTILADRDAEYTREVGDRIVDAYFQNNVVHCTHITAKAIFDLMRERNPRMDVLRLIRSGGMDEDIEHVRLIREVDHLLQDLRKLANNGGVRLGASADGSAEDVVAAGLAHYATYHAKTAAVRRGDRIVPADRNLLFYYQNRLEGYGLGRRSLLTRDHRALAKVA